MQSARSTGSEDQRNAAMVRLLRMLKQGGYHFTAVTPDTQALVNARASSAEARSLADVLGHNRPFRRELLAPALFETLRAAGACERVLESELWRATLRVSAAGGELFYHSPFPTLQPDAVFFGPDSYRFVQAVLAGVEPALRAVDVGCGTGVAGILLAKAGLVRHELILADINERALQAASVNSQAAGVRSKVVHSDVLAGVDGEVDLVLANPPYLNDASQRVYRHGGGAHGEALGLRIVHEALARLARSPTGGTLLLYTGAPVRDGQDLFFAAVEAELGRAATSYSYRELDPDVFSSELAKPAYRDVERIAAVFLKARVAPGRAP